MTEFWVTLTATDRTHLVRQALAAEPAECCGLLVGREQGDGIVITDLHPSENLATEKHTSFEIDFRIRLHLEEALADGPDRIIGLYHSHPAGGLEPSAIDLADAAEDGLVWVILAVDAVGAVNLSAWKLNRPHRGVKSFSPLTVQIN